MMFIGSFLLNFLGKGCELLLISLGSCYSYGTLGICFVSEVVDAMFPILSDFLSYF